MARIYRDGRFINYAFDGYRPEFTDDDDDDYNGSTYSFGFGFDPEAFASAFEAKYFSNNDDSDGSGYSFNEIESECDDDEDYAKYDITPKCAQCLKTADQTKDLVLRICSRCKSAHYCTRKCQKIHWIHHKDFCEGASQLSIYINCTTLASPLKEELNDNLARLRKECKSWPVHKSKSGLIVGPIPPEMAKTLYLPSLGKLPEKDRPPEISSLGSLSNIGKNAFKGTASAAKASSTTKTAAPTNKTISTKNTATLNPPKATTNTKPSNPTNKTTSSDRVSTDPTLPSTPSNIKLSKPTKHHMTVDLSPACDADVRLSTNSTDSPIFKKEPGQEVISSGLIKQIKKPYRHLTKKTWLHDRPEEDVYKLLIDCFRLRQHDNFTIEKQYDKDSVYGGASHSQAGFKRFLVLAESRTDLLPGWWFMGKAAANCLRFGGGLGVTGTEWSSLARKVDKAAIINHYTNPEMPLQLRLLAEQIYLRGPGGESGKQMLAYKEGAERTGMYDTLFDMSRLFPNK
ncbi:hypothetical protein FBU30_010887 [Linnemannia zychae]|nr:hypothetical protein FBU30_010887 [Linnemannia zychae]